MTTTVSVHEVTDFRTAVCGIAMDWVRSDLGWGPAFMVTSGDEHAAVSTGGLDFSTFMRTEVPGDRVGFQLMTVAPPGTRYCGSETRCFELRTFHPTMPVVARIPAGARAVTTAVWTESFQRVAEDLGLGEVGYPSLTGALPRTPEVVALVDDLMQIAAAPELLDAPTGTTRLVESTVRALASVGTVRRRPDGRRFDSRGIVTACLDHVVSTGRHQPTISELCRVAYASESRLREAFVEVLGLPPHQFFQLRVLSMLRNELLIARPGEASVTSVATSLGLTQLGRAAGRYRAIFGETPRDTLHRSPIRRG